MATATKKTKSRAASSKAAKPNKSSDTIAAAVRDVAKLAKRERSVAEAWLKYAHRIRDNFNIADKTVEKALGDAIKDALVPHFGKSQAAKYKAYILSIARAKKLPAEKDAPRNLQQYAAKCRELNPTQKRATGGATKGKAAKGKMLHVADVAKQISGNVSGMKKRPATAEANALLQQIEDLLSAIETK